MKVRSFFVLFDDRQTPAIVVVGMTQDDGQAFTRHRGGNDFAPTAVTDGNGGDRRDPQSARGESVLNRRLRRLIDAKFL